MKKNFPRATASLIISLCVGTCVGVMVCAAEIRTAASENSKKEESDHFCRVTVRSDLYKDLAEPVDIQTDLSIVIDSEEMDFSLPGTSGNDLSYDSDVTDAWGNSAAPEEEREIVPDNEAEGGWP